MLCAGLSAGTVINGELKVWHKVTLAFDGPATSETATPNPFMDYRLNVTLTGPSGQVYVVPGYFAADGNAANTSASAGNQWHAHLSPDEAGLWGYSVSFRTGPNLAVSDDPGAGSSGGFMDGETDSFVIEPTDKTGRDFRGKGLLEYVGMHHLQFAGTGAYFLKCGVDSPENFLAYAEFDGPFKTDGQTDFWIKTWSPHVADWQPGDPTWASVDGAAGTYGKGMIGALNYLAAEGLNAFSFLTLSIDGDDRNVFMYTDYNERLRLDVSRLAQWEIVFEHADTLGLYLHFKTQETENDHLLDGGELGPQRRLYYRELIARFGHHLAQILAFSDYFDTHDPYRHPVVLHTYPNEKELRYEPLLGVMPGLQGLSLQTQFSDFIEVHEDVRYWVQQSAAVDKPWVVACDEPGNASDGLVPDSDVAAYDPGRNNARRHALWGAVMGGGAGLEWFFGSQHANSDRTCEDYRSRDLWWDQCRVMQRFFDHPNIPFWEMVSHDPLTSDTDDHCLKKEGVIYLVFLPTAQATSITLGSGDFIVRWFNPRTGGNLQFGSVVDISGPGVFPVGSPPSDPGTDWLAVITPGPFWAADFDWDGDVDLEDVVRLAADWLRCNDPQDAGCEASPVVPAPADCQAVRDLGLLLETDVSGPGGVPDCRVNLFDFAELAAYWLVQ
jgi:hypothetical protein